MGKAKSQECWLSYKTLPIPGQFPSTPWKLPSGESALLLYTEISMMLEISGYMDLFLWDLTPTNGG